MNRIILCLALFAFTSNAIASIKESWTCYRNGSEFLQMNFDGKTYKASLQGVLETINLKGSGERPELLKGEERPFYDTVNYTVKVDRSKVTTEGLDRATMSTSVTLHRDGYWDCYGSFSDSETLDCTLEIERD